MIFKKYLAFVLIMLFIGVTNVYAINNYTLATSSNIEKMDFSINDGGGQDVNVDCSIFGSKNDPNSIAYIVNEVLQYPRYIVPALLILLGSLDFFKAVLGGKEDNMKKAQATFIKRLIIGVIIFLIPAIVNGLMWLTDIAWEGLGYTTCGM